jgi:hypothetical protein
MKKILGCIIFFVILDASYGSIFAAQDVKIDDQPQVSHEAEETTCSQYCIEAIKKHGTFLGWIMCSDRLIRCGRDEKKLSDPTWIDGVKRSYDPVSNNDFWWQ